MASRSVMLITFTGRKSGKTYTTPISYARDGDQVTAFTGARWSKNLEGGAPVTLNIKNKEYHGWADVVANDKAAVTEGLMTFLSKVRSDAGFYKVNFDDDDQPNWEDVQRAAQECVMLRVQLDATGDTLQQETSVYKSITN
jgi:hypothetical protein